MVEQLEEEEDEQQEENDEDNVEEKGEEEEDHGTPRSRYIARFFQPRRVARATAPLQYAFRRGDCELLTVPDHSTTF